MSQEFPQETPGYTPNRQPVTSKDRVSYEVNSIGATGVEHRLLARATICVGTRIVQPFQTSTMNGSDYADLPSGLLWAYH